MESSLYPVVASVVFLAICVGLFLVFRVLVLWYWRVNEVVRILEAIDAKLGVLVGRDESRKGP
jgi:hypothetical protein